ncbi:YdbL family protein [Erythrobacter sp.]|uniref:YdbL family protein n=1 Tax=Erythrobacter sp. TaxID=1042 RepID=UPI0025CD6CF0|nr:YdbL family protein [Erythrobacter sp.]
MRRLTFGGLAAAAMLGMVAAPAMADRDPAYAAARAAGEVGEQPDGYIGIVGPANPALQRVVDNINIKRKAVYSEKAKENKATIEAYALSSGCQAIARTTPGEKYRAPDGSWQTRTSAPPIRDPRCP